MSALGAVLGWLGAAERIFVLVKRVIGKGEPKPEEQAPPHPTWKDVDHIRRQIDAGARPFPPAPPARPKPPPPPRRR